MVKKRLDIFTLRYDGERKFIKDLWINYVLRLFIYYSLFHIHKTILLQKQTQQNKQTDIDLIVRKFAIY